MKLRDKKGRFRKEIVLDRSKEYQIVYNIVIEQLQKELIKARNKAYERTN